MPRYPHVVVDLQHRSISVYLRGGSSVGTRELDDAHLVDFDAAGQPISIEILTPDDWKLEEMGERFGFGEDVPMIKAELNRVLFAPTGTAASYGQPLEIKGKPTVDVSAEAEGHTAEPIWEMVP